MSHQSIYNDIIIWIINNDNNNIINHNNNQNNNNNINDDDDFWHNMLDGFIMFSGYQQFLMRDDITQTDVDLYTDIMDLLIFEILTTPHLFQLLQPQHIQIILTLAVEVGHMIISQDNNQSLEIEWMETLESARHQFTFTPAVNSTFEKETRLFDATVSAPVGEDQDQQELVVHGGLPSFINHLAFQQLAVEEEEENYHGIAYHGFINHLAIQQQQQQQQVEEEEEGENVIINMALTMGNYPWFAPFSCDPTFMCGPLENILNHKIVCGDLYKLVIINNDETSKPPTMQVINQVFDYLQEYFGDDLFSDIKNNNVHHTNIYNNHNNYEKINHNNYYNNNNKIINNNNNNNHNKKLKIQLYRKEVSQVVRFMQVCQTNGAIDLRDLYQSLQQLI
ncbi:hypothetical protein DFA_02335 [Cavenderia fasciculata]|uniref:Uncharacterized protein n=1 Tax=Cavenderia fasciculata TaxID=261658 RepID=F4PZ60_CACFS|nr:uncharacterized protein DFA_02335 [Cavenderia fasciculata]EGG19089.1 hypothetical protein DFA_02335 [Cavenderia fasciculata]|eukprot:XP_004366722.1 hypothetical protein DFA_02335 [Cavenderia fasciculata]